MNINVLVSRSLRTQSKYNILRIKTTQSYCNCSTVLISTNNVTSKLQQSASNSKWIFYNNYRKMSSTDDSGPPSTKLPPLMEFPKVTWPSVIKSLRNFILATFIIKPYLDRDFNLTDFVFGSKKALEVVSKKIAEGDIKSLDGLVTDDIKPSLQRAVSHMSLLQREQLAVNIDDIYFSFPYQIGVIFKEDNEQKRFVEITMVFHVLRGLGLMRSRGEDPPLNMGMMPEYQSRISICNYRFIREFTKGIDSDWTINLLNHWKPIDEMEENEN